MHPLRTIALLTVLAFVALGCSKKDAPAAAADDSLTQVSTGEAEPAAAPTDHDLDEDTRAAAPDQEPGVEDDTALEDDADDELADEPDEADELPEEPAEDEMEPADDVEPAEDLE
jgi:hypothetical protein